MKKLLVVFAIVCATSIFAQVKEGVITYKMTLDSPNEEVKAQLAMAGDMKSVSYIKGNKSKTVVSGAMGGQTAIVDMDSKETLILMNNPMMGKFYTKSSIDEEEKEGEKKPIVTKTDETKEILGYTCTKYTVKTEAGAVTLYATDKITAPSMNSTKFKEVKGFPLEIELGMNQGGMLIIVKSVATEIKEEKVDDSQFDMTIPEGYTEKKKEELKGM